MNATVLIPPQTVNLTTLEIVKGELKLTTTDAARDAWIQDRIEQASLAIQDELDRPLTRQQVQERFDGNGRMLAALELTPIASLDSLKNAWLGEIDLSITTLGNEVARIDNAEAGLIWRNYGFADDSPQKVWLTVDSMAQAGAKPWQATYHGGWLTRADDLTASGFTASGTDIIRNDGGIMPLVAPGDQIALSGWALNRGRFVVSARTDDSISVENILVVEVAGAGAAVQVRNLPAGLERACIDTVRSWFYLRTQNTGYKAESIGDWSATYGDPTGAAERANVLPGAVVTTLDRWRRLM